MRRYAFVLALLAVLLAGCGVPGSKGVPGGKVVAPLPDTVIGKTPAAPAAAKGDPAAGKGIYVAQGCGGCHTYKPSGSAGKIGPDLDKLPAYAKAANQGSLADFTRTSIVNPGAYLQKGYANQMPATYGTSLSGKQVSDLVAFLTAGP